VGNALYDVGVYLGNVGEELWGADSEDLRVFPETDESYLAILSSATSFRERRPRSYIVETPASIADPRVLQQTMPMKNENSSKGAVYCPSVLKDGAETETTRLVVPSIQGAFVREVLTAQVEVCKQRG
jgi:hypothetical protein